MARRLVGLRPRLLLALLATAALTLAAAALALLPPLQARLRSESARSLRSTALASRPSFAQALGSRDCDRVVRQAIALESRTNARVTVVDNVPAIVCGSGYGDFGGAPDVQAALTKGRAVLARRGDELDLTVPVLHGRAGLPRYAIVVRKPLSDVRKTVGQVRRAFVTAALVGLLAAVLLGLGFTTTLLRRLERLRRSVLRVGDEGPDAAPPRDDRPDEIGDLSRAFAAMQAALGRQEEARRAFVATASHELRTPLTSLQGTLELLGEDLDEGRVDLSDAREQVAGARAELRRLANLATELLDLSRLDAGVALRSEPVELGELARAVASEFELRAREGDVEIDVVQPPGPCWARGDPVAVARILRILLDNALRFSPPGESVSVTAAYHGEQAALEVADRGPGVPDDERELIFERFQRGSRTGGEAGFGLGLAIGRELARRLGGELRLEPGEVGARFACRLAIELPAGGRDPAPDEALSPPVRPAVP